MRKHLLLALSLLLCSISIYAQCPPGQAQVVVSIVEDDYPNETTWDLRDAQGSILASGDVTGGTACVDTGICLSFTIYDSYGDGICCSWGQGSYSVTYNGQVVASGGEFQFEESTDFNCPPGYSCHSAIVVSEGNHFAPQNNYWYSFTPDSVGTYTISTCQGNTCDTKIWVYDYCNGLVWSNSNQATIYYDDNQGGCGLQARVNAIFAPGETYYIRIGDVNNSCASSGINWELIYNGPVVGCTDPQACNYNPLATVSDTCIYPGSPLCPDGPDLIVRNDVLETSAYLTTLNANDACWIAEGCMNGYGQRNIVRFTTHIQNIGNQDYYIGSPNAQPGQFEWDACHNHWHYEGYAEYLLYDEDGTEIPIGFKNGFCVLDLECSGGGTAQYGCGNMGISTGCGDIYDQGLDCQWIDITDVDTGLYTFVVRTNWDFSPDALGRLELDHHNNWAQICIRLSRDGQGVLSMTIESDCDPFIDCAGNIYGPAQPDCEGICNGTALRGDVDANSAQEMLDAMAYVDGIIANDLLATNCNDLNADGDIDVYDPALLVNCLLFGGNHQHPGGGGIHDHCNLPGGIINIYDTVAFSIQNVNLEEKYFDVYIQNPADFVVGYELDFHGITIESAENLISSSWYPVTPQWGLGGTKVVSLSYQDSTINKYWTPTPLLRVNYFSLTDTIICIDKVVSVVNSNYEEVIPRIDGGCVASDYVGVEEHITDLGVTVQPNPFNNSTLVSFKNTHSMEFEVTLRDLTGKLIREPQKVTGASFTIERNNLAPGIYFLDLRGENGFTAREKLTIY